MKSFDCLRGSTQLTEPKVIIASNVKIESKFDITLVFDEDKIPSFEIENDDEKKTLIFSNVPLNKWKAYCPRFIFGKDYCSVKYYKNGLLWKLKDTNGNQKIPFKISFGTEIYVGDAALEYPKLSMPEIDLEILLHD